MSKVTTVDGPRRSFIAGADLSAKQYYIVKLGSTDNQVIAATTAQAGLLVGVLQNAPKSGDSASVLLRNAQGTGKVVIGTGGCSAGDALTSGATTDAGKAIVTTTTSDQVIGYALHAASAGDIAEFVPAGFVTHA